MGKRHKPPRRVYPLHQSPLYKCGSRARLASLLHLNSVVELEALANDGERTYRVFSIHQKGKKPRAVQQPVGARNRVHQRLFAFVRRIEPPDYLHSGVSGRSNITNAEAHLGHHPLLKTDIKSFYVATGERLVFRMFRERFRCSPDVSALLTKLCTVNGHVPTGSSLSQLLAFYAVKPRLDKFAALCAEQGVTMTVYVDDITVSGKWASHRLMYDLKRLLAAEGYSCHKDVRYRAAERKVVTGVIVTANEIRVRNRHHQRIYEELYKLLGQEPSPANTNSVERLSGRIASAIQIDPGVDRQKKTLKAWCNNGGL